MKKLIIFIFIFSSLLSSSQYYNDGQDRSGIKWKKISSIHFEVIFPEGFEEQGEHVVKLMEKSYQYVTQTLQHKPKKISVILHTETVKSNAFLGWAPSRIEMYVTPHQGIYAQDWLEQLAIHEYRHMVQISKLESEMPKLLRILFGEQAAALLTAAYLPFWFVEGDAVAVETGLSESGRGRLPDFHRELKAQVLDKGIYSYDKAYLGSYKDHVANHYHLGYFLVGGARKLYGKTIWDEVLNHVARNPLSIAPFSRGLKKSIGINKVELYDTILTHLSEQWKTEDAENKITHLQLLTKENKFHTDYQYGLQLADSSILALKTGLAEMGKFIKIENGIEKTIFIPGYPQNESVSGKENTLIWMERIAHPRWYHSDRSLLRIYDAEKDLLREFSYNTKLFSPSLSPDMKNVVAVEVDNQYRFKLVIINPETGEIIKEISNPENLFFITPSWSEDGKSIVTIAMQNNQKGIVNIDVQSEKIAMILDYSNQEVKRSIQYNKSIYFIGAYSGTDNLYTSENGQIQQIISSRFGISDFNIINNKLLLSVYTSDGYKLASVAIDSIKPLPVSIKQIQKTYPIAEAISNQEKGVIDFSKLDDINYKAEKYNKAEHLFKIHSWAPLAIDPLSQTANLGFSVMSQNMLSTSEFIGGYRYRITDEQGEFFANYKYFGWFPVIEADASTGKHESSFSKITNYVNQNNEIVRTDTVNQAFNWNETNFSIKSYLPINLSKGKYYAKIQPRIKYRISSVNPDESAYKGFPNGVFHSMETGIYMYRLLKKSEQDLLSNFGVFLDVSYLRSLDGVLNYGSLISVSNTFYLPGIMPNHGITLYNGYQRKERMEYAFSDRIKMPRGHLHVLNDQLYTFASDYQLPLIYTDINLFNLAYIKRVRMKLFYDFASYTGSTFIGNSVQDYSGTLQSSGVELKTDAHFLRFIAPIELGLRTSYLFNESFKFDFLFNIEFTF